MKIQNCSYSQIMIAGTYKNNKWHYQDTGKNKSGLYFVTDDETKEVIAESWWTNGEGSTDDTRLKFLPKEMQEDYFQAYCLEDFFTNKKEERNLIKINEIYYNDLLTRLILNEGESLSKQLGLSKAISIYSFHVVIVVLDNDIIYLKDKTDYKEYFHILEDLLQGEYVLDDTKNYSFLENNSVYECDLTIRFWEDNHPLDPVEYNQEHKLFNFKKIV